MSEDEDPTYTLDAYVNQLRNTVYAAYEDHDEADVHERLEGLLFEFLDDYEPRIDSPAAFAEELDALVRNAYVPPDQLVAVLEDEIDDLESLGAGDSLADAREMDADPAEADAGSPPDDLDSSEKDVGSAPDADPTGDDAGSPGTGSPDG